MNSKKLRRDINEAEFPERTRLIEDAKTAVKKFIADTERSLQALRHSRMSTDPHWRTVGRESKRLAHVLVGADVFAQFALGLIYLPALGLFVIGASSIATAVVVALAVGSAGWIFAMKALHPLRAVRILRDLAGVIGVITIGGVVVLVATKVATGAMIPLLSTLFPLALVAVAETMPVVGGLMWACARIIDWPDRLEADLTAANRFLQWLDGQGWPPGSGPPAPPDAPLARPPASPGDKPSGGEVPSKPNGSGVAATVVLAALLAGPLASRAAAQPKPSQTGSSEITQVSPVHNSTVSILNSLSEWDCWSFVDGTTSVDPRARTRAVGLFLEPAPLAAFLRAAGCRTLSFATFTDAGTFTPLQTVSIPSTRHLSDCSHPSLNVTPAAAVLASVQSNFRAFFYTQAKDSCLVRARQTEAQYNDGISDVSKTLGAVLLPETLPPGHCTDILNLLRYATESPGVAVFFTDAKESCNNKWAEARISNSSARVIFILVPSRGAIAVTGPAVLSRAKEWSHVIPNFQAVPYTQMSPSVWGQLLH